MKSKFLGKFIVFEGIDGSGKSTQAKLLLNNFKKAGFKTAFIHFPQYGTKAGGLVEEYLSGKYGKASEVSPYQASIFYSCDRFDASFKIRKWLEQGKIVICDRYIGSNVGHQGGKIKDKEERKKYLNWLNNLEYNILKIPKPDITFILKMPAVVGQSLSEKIANISKKAKKISHLRGKLLDIHEEDLGHLSNTERSYLEWAEEFPEDLTLIECIENNELLSPKIISQRIWQIVEKALN